MNLSKKAATRRFTKLDNFLSNVLKFDIETEQERKKAEKVIGYNPPEIDRIKETAPQVVFRKIIDGHKILILSSYRTDTGNFTKAGKIWCHVIAPKKKVGDDTKYTRIIYRRGDFIAKAMHEAEFLCCALVNRPLDLKNRPMVLEENPRNEFNWVSPRNKDEKISFFHAIPGTIKDEILKTKYQRDYYHETTRPKEGIVVYARDIRVLGKKKTPQNAVPVMN